MIGFKMSNTQPQQCSRHEELAPKAQAILALAELFDEELCQHAKCIDRHDKFAISLRLARKLNKIYVKYYEPEI